ncbi:unnamed protein product [Mortierella alpina]
MTPRQVLASHHGLAVTQGQGESKPSSDEEKRHASSIQPRPPEQQQHLQQLLQQKLQRALSRPSMHLPQPLRILPPLSIPSYCGSIAHSAYSTTTAFYSGVKLAPPVQSATVEQVERRALDQKAWYTIQVCPYDITIPSPTSASSPTSPHSAIATRSEGSQGSIGMATTTIPRKPYTIYRRYEDVADFADQLEEEFPLLKATAATPAAQPAATPDAYGTLSAEVSCPDLGSASELLNSKALGGQCAKLATTTNQASATATAAAALTAGALTQPLCLPRLKSSLVLFVTKAVCLQRKEELDRYLRQLFALGPFIAQSRLVAEFFGIWKTDMEAHLRQEDRDPLALHPVVVHTTTTTATISTTMVNEPKTAIKSEAENKEDEEEEEEEKRDNKEEQLEQESKASTVAPSNSEHSPPFRITAEPTVSAATNVHSTLNLVPDRALDSSATISSPRSSCSFSSVSSPSSSPSSLSDFDGTSSADTMTIAAVANTYNYLASPSVSPSPSMVGSRITDWAAMSASTIDTEMQDLEMSSPTHTSPSPSPSPRPELSENSSVESEGSKSQSNDITTRTIKKFKSLRRAHTTTSATPTRQSIFHQLQQQPPKEGRSAQEEAREYGINNGITAVSSTTGGPPPLPIPTGTQSQGTAAKAKSMKRSKTIVFRPEVTMQPLSSKNVIPPWNRIPSVVASSTASSAASSIHSPISPASPTTPVAGGSHHPFMSLFSSNNSSNNMVVGESVTATTPTSLDPEDRPRKLAMSQSKTMPSLALWSTESSPSSPSNSPHSPVHPLLHNSTAGNSSVRALLSSSYSTTTLVAPWNRANSSSETSTHLHSLIKISSSSSSGQPSNSLLSPAELPSVPVELGRSFQKKEIFQQRSLSQSQAALLKRDPTSIPVLSHPPEARNKTVVVGAEASSATFSAGRKGSKSGMTHSISAPGGFLPLMTVSRPPLETPKKRSARRESATATLNGPALPTKQPVGILKNAQQSFFGMRKSSLSVPGPVMFPVQPIAVTAKAAGPAVVTTFKIVLDADTIVALQVIEDQKFILTLQDLKSRVKSKLLKSNVQLPEKFDLLWSMPSSTSSTVPSTPSTPASATSFSSASSACLNTGVALRTDEELHRAIHSSRNHKVILRCTL